MIRVIVRTVDRQGAVHVGGPVDVEHKSFDLNLPGLEAYLRAGYGVTLVTREVVGVEVVEPLHPTPEGGKA